MGCCAELTSSVCFLLPLGFQLLFLRFPFLQGERAWKGFHNLVDIQHADLAQIFQQPLSFVTLRQEGLHRLVAQPEILVEAIEKANERCSRDVGEHVLPIPVYMVLVVVADVPVRFIYCQLVKLIHGTKLRKQNGLCNTVAYKNSPTITCKAISEEKVTQWEN